MSLHVGTTAATEIPLGTQPKCYWSAIGASVFSKFQMLGEIVKSKARLKKAL